jgi:hypothetical protein
MKNDKPTPYRYNDKGEIVNVVKMDFEDWWNSIRLADAEVTTANKFLLETKLIEIHKMRIKVKDKNIFKPSNCYTLNLDNLERYLNILTNIKEEIYKTKVSNVRELNIRTSHTHRDKLSTDLSTDNAVTLETGVTLKQQALYGINKNLSTISTLSTPKDSSVTRVSRVTKATLETEVTIVTPETQVAKATLETGVANKSYTSFTNTSTDTSYTEKEKTSYLPFTYYWDKTLNILKEKISILSYNTWIESGITDIKNEGNNVIIKASNKFTEEILIERFLDIISNTLNEITGRKYELKIIF